MGSLSFVLCYFANLNPFHIFSLVIFGIFRGLSFQRRRWSQPKWTTSWSTAGADAGAPSPSGVADLGFLWGPVSLWCVPLEHPDIIIIHILYVYTDISWCIIYIILQHMIYYNVYIYIYIYTYCIILLYITDIWPFLTSEHPSHFTISWTALDPAAFRQHRIHGQWNNSMGCTATASWQSWTAKAEWPHNKSPAGCVFCGSERFFRNARWLKWKSWKSNGHEEVQWSLEFLAWTSAMEGSSQVSPFNPGAADGVPKVQTFEDFTWF